MNKRIMEIMNQLNELTTVRNELIERNLNTSADVILEKMLDLSKEYRQLLKGVI